MKRALFVLIVMSSAMVSTRGSADCPEPAVEGVQPCDAALSTAFSRAAANSLGSDGPDLGMIGEGRPSSSVSARFPCALLAAIGQVESTWRQFSATGTCGGTGPTLISFDCGYGVMQITSGMDGTAGFDPPSVARGFVYNVGTGARILGQKWRTTPYVGVNNPDLVECWYYAVWAYNGFSYINNPHNPRYAATRMPYRSDAGGARSDYPYQEVVWGYLRSPVADRWPTIEVSYPDDDEICGTATSCFPGNLSMPMPSHTGACAGLPVELDAGVAPDASSDASMLDAALLDSGDVDASNLDASRIDAPALDSGVVHQQPSGCSCSAAGARLHERSLLALALGLLLVLARKRARQ
jgi:hypothetical protein